jgi:hypothetical protein
MITFFGNTDKMVRRLKTGLCFSLLINMVIAGWCGYITWKHNKFVEDHNELATVTSSAISMLVEEHNQMVSIVNDQSESIGFITTGVTNLIAAELKNDARVWIKLIDIEEKLKNSNSHLFKCDM